MDRRSLLAAGAAGAALAAATASACTSGAPREQPSKSGPPTATGGTGRPSAGASPAAWTALARSLAGSLVRPGDAAYPTARQLYNTRFDSLEPAAVAYVANDSDVQECLAFARAHRTPVALRNGGHSYAGWSSGTGRLVLDVSKLNRVRADGDTATVGAGARLLDVYLALGRTGRTIPGGSCPTVGITGLTLGGGHGVATRAYGATCDSLTSATLITADGKRLTADADRESDLFWALRGAGNGNFGVVTELGFRTHDAPQAVTAYLTWPWARARAVIEAWQEWGPDQPDEIWSAAHLAAAAGGTGAGAAPTVGVSAFSLGSYGDLQNTVDRLADRVGAPAASVSLHRHGYTDAMLAYAGCATLSEAQCHLAGATPGRTAQGALQRETYAARSAFFDRAVPADGVRALLARTEAFGRVPVGQGGGAGSVALTALGGALNRVSPTATAFVHRRSRVLAQYIASWRPGTPGTAQRAWLNTTHDALSRYANGAAYQNYADPELKDWRKAYYGAAAPRLAELKRRYDPTRVFDFPQAL
ncbi:FAD-binding oxidoreductase [Streptomyces sp. NBC_00648]|uniref:FAD-binding oxidoreductase n=1 Tax=Streptomyces sp. NBC_00648 TaxID=2975797 RepID=UPI00324F0E3E